MTNISPQRIALVGAGYISEWHAKAVRSLPGLSLQAVCDTSTTRASEMAATFAIPKIYHSIVDLAKDPDIDSVHVLLPPDLHFSAAKSLLNAGKSVFLEKPMCLEEAECRELTKLAADRRLRLGVGHNFLFHRAYEPLRRDVQAGVLGWIDRISIVWHKELPQLRHGPFGIWMVRQPENVLMEVGSHAFAALLDLTEFPNRIEGRASNGIVLPSNVEIPQNWNLLCASGKTITDISISLGSGFSEFSIHVRGSLGSATADLERNSYICRLHTARADDFNRRHVLLMEARGLKNQANQGIRNYVLSKFSKSIAGNPYGESIQRGICAFYSDHDSDRLSGSAGANVISACRLALSEISQDPKQVIAASAIEPDRTSTIVRSRDDSAQILILGGTGFIGQALCRTLVEQGYKIRLLVRDPLKLSADLRSSGVEIVRGDLSNSTDLENAMRGVEYVYHLARPMVKRWDEYLAQDVAVTERIARTCQQENVKMLIYTGTIDSYYAGAKAGVITEMTPLDPNVQSRNLYARSKAVSEDLLWELHKEQGLRLVVARPGIVIGKGTSPSHWGIGMWHHGSFCEVWGDGCNPLPLVLVDDVADGLAAMIGKPEIIGQSFNLVGDTTLTAKEYLDELDRYSGLRFGRSYTSPWKFYVKDLGKWVVKCLVRHPDRRMPSYRDWESRTQRAVFDCSETKRKLNWQPTDSREVLIRKGIHEPIDELR